MGVPPQRKPDQNASTVVAAVANVDEPAHGEETAVALSVEPTGHLRTTPRIDSVRFDYDGSGNLVYVGKSAPNKASSEAAWQIRKFFYDGSGNLTTTQWADGNRLFDNVWDSRASLSYS